MTQLSLELDAPRLAKQLAAVRAVLLAAGGAWLSFGEIAQRGGLRPTQAASISARIRELRHCGTPVDKRRRGRPEDGLWEYRIGGMWA